MKATDNQTISNPLAMERLAVCSWSLQPTTPAELADRLEATGIKRVQLALDPLRENPATWGKIAEVFASRGLRIVTGMFGCVGEDYTTLESIRVTGGIAPDHTWEQNLKNVRASVQLMKRLGLKYATFHAGFLPHDETDPAFAKMLGRLTQVADIFATENLTLGMETGQETADSLVQVLRTLNRPNVGVNFDPANMILYAKGDPIEALRVLGPWIRHVHIKDAVQTKVAGTWGQEVPVGTGQVNWKAFFSALGEIKYAGDFVIEREAGTRRVEDIRTAKEVVLKTAVF